MGSNDTKGIWGVIVLAASPLLLIHGYSEDASVWDSWVDWLKSDNFTNVYPVTFEGDDECGTVADHAAQLSHIVNQTGTEQVNMVVHSKAGLDARSYIAQNPGRVANLVMIATPNLGTAAAYTDLTTCSFQGSAGLGDMQPDSAATKSPDQNATKYFSIAGDYPIPCLIAVEKAACFVVPNDGFVEVESALSNYPSLGTFPYSHNSLLTEKDVYEKILPILRP